MELFEVLIILVFIGLPLIEGVLKQRRKGRMPGQEAPGRATGQLPGTGAEGRRGAGTDRPPPGPEAEEGPAAEMIPADLWEVLTGERRPSAPAPEEPAEEWVLAGEPVVVEDAPWERPESDWGPSRWETEQRELEQREAEVERDVPDRLEEAGEVVSLEVLPPPPDVRQRMFHARYAAIDEEMPAPERGLPYDLRGALRGAGLRRAVLLNEILGPPKGLG